MVEQADAEIGLIISQVEKQFRRSGDSSLEGTYEPQQEHADDRRQRTFSSTTKGR
jgi:hypothetical protein